MTLTDGAFRHAKILSEGWVESLIPIKSLTIRLCIYAALFVLLWVTGVIPALFGLLSVLAQVWLFLLLAPVTIYMIVLVVRFALPR